MNYQLNLFRQNRENILELLDQITLEEGNATPQGFRNNIIWNAGHTLMAQEFLLYYFSGLPMNVPEEYPAMFGAGSMARTYTAAEFRTLKEYLRQTLEKVPQDLARGAFSEKEYNPYSSEYFGATMSNIDEAFQFNVLHEGVHFGYMLALRRALSDGAERIFR